MLWRLSCRGVLGLARGAAWLVRAPAAWLTELHARHRQPRIVAQVAQPGRARLLERALRRAAVRQCRALGFNLPDELLVLVGERLDSFGERAALLERETRADGSVRYLLQLALAPQARPSGLSVDALMAELGRQLLVLQRSVEGTSACLVEAAEGESDLAFQGPFAPTLEPRVIPFRARNGRPFRPSDEPSEPA